MDECVSHRQIVLKQSSFTNKSNKGDLSWANGNQKIIVKCFWKEHAFWTDGYFVCSVGNVSGKMLSYLSPTTEQQMLAYGNDIIFTVVLNI